jgi:osmotically-inducible protein OsmY
MDSIRARAAATAASLVLLAGLAACGDRVENTEIPQASQANVEINRQGMEGAKDADAAVGVENKQAEQQAHLDTLGAKGDTSVMDPDVLIAEQVKTALQTSPEFGSSSKVDVHSQDGEVTLRGRAPDPTARDRAADIARSIPNVRSVDNQLTLG